MLPTTLTVLILKEFSTDGEHRIVAGVWELARDLLVTLVRNLDEQPNLVRRQK